MEKAIKDKVIKRFYSCVKRSNHLHISPPTRELFLELIEESLKEGFKCFYCKEDMSLVDPPRIFSFDHVVPLSNGGNNLKENLKVCCVRCNLIKGTLSLKSFNLLINKLTSEERTQLFQEWFHYFLSNKIARVKGES